MMALITSYMMPLLAVLPAPTTGEAGGPPCDWGCYIGWYHTLAATLRELYGEDGEMERPLLVGPAEGMVEWNDKPPVSEPMGILLRSPERRGPQRARECSVAEATLPCLALSLQRCRPITVSTTSQHSGFASWSGRRLACWTRWSVSQSAC